MSTYFNIVNLDKKEQASLVIRKTKKEVDETIALWEEQNSEKWYSEERQARFAQLDYEFDPAGYKRQEDGSWEKEIKKFYQHHQKLVFGFIFWEACADQWGHVSSWFGDRVIVTCDGCGSKDLYDQLDFHEIDETFKPVKFYVSYEDWMDAQR
ncbi:hypothetical protein [Burkholderia cenocepacia]|uniref:hypothetical protein n=1 Tax=Burkholderia cenocepacia TaxID=95486 RepID=UPI0011157C96|nr:hypothetical protein [Burkholderia cenocepacia]